MPRLEDRIAALLEPCMGSEGARVKSLRPLGGGCINHAVHVETGAGPVVVKWNDSAPPGLFLREAEGLRHLREAGSGLRIPEVLAAGEADGGGPAMIALEYLEPSPLPPDAATWQALGRGLARLHRRQADAFGFFADNYLGPTPQPNTWMGNWSEFYAQKRLEPLLRALEPRKSAREMETARHFLARLPAILGHRPRPSLIHGDLWSGNFLNTAQGPALLDPAVYFADREAELAMMLLFGGFPERVFAAYGEEFALPADWRERTPVYQLHHLLNHELLFGGGYGRQAWGIMARFLHEGVHGRPAFP